MVSIVLTSVTAKYAGAEQEALVRLDLTIRAGECLLVAGPNGSGKSTLARVLSGILPPVEGCVEWESGIPHTQWPPGWVSWVRADRHHMIGQTVAEEVGFSPAFREKSWARAVARARWALKRFHIGDWGSRSLDGLSAGQVRRVNMAAGFSQHPGLLILDEPEAMLDGYARRMVQDALHDLRAAGQSVLILSHDLTWLSYADRVLWMESGIGTVYSSREDFEKDHGGAEWARFLENLEDYGGAKTEQMLRILRHWRLTGSFVPMD